MRHNNQERLHNLRSEPPSVVEEYEDISEMAVLVVIY